MRSPAQIVFSVILVGISFLAGRESASQEPAAWMPASSTLIAHLDLGTLLSNANFHGLDRLLEARLEPGALEQFRELTGMDPWRDVYSISYFSEPGEENQQTWGIAVTGAFDVERILTSLEERTKVARIEHRETPIFIPHNLAALGGGPSRAFALVNGNRILFGLLTSVKVMLDVSMGIEPSSAQGELAPLLDRISTAETVWVVSIGETNLPDQFQPQGTNGVSIPTLDSFAMTVRAGSDVRFRLEGSARDSESAGKLADILRGAMAFAALSRDSGGALTDITQSLELETLDRRLDVSFEIDSRTVRDWLREQQERLADRTP